MENTLLKRPWLVPVVLAILTIILFRPVILPPEAGHVLDSHDLVNMFYPQQEFNRQAIQNGELPLWNPYLFIGVPHIGNPHVALFYPASWFVWLAGTQRGIGLMMVLHSWLGAWGMAHLTRRFGATYVGGVLAGVVYAMSGWAAARYYAGHYNLELVFGWLPWVLAAYHYAMLRKSWRALLPGMAAFGVALLAGYTPLMVTIGLALVAMWVYHTAKDDDFVPDGWRAGWRLAVIVVGGVLLSAASVLPAAELSQLAVRKANDLDFAMQYALPPAQIVSALAVPDLFGHPHVEPSLYWGDYFFEEDTAYAGLLPLLALPLIFRCLRREAWYFLGLIALGLVLSLGVEGALLPILVRWVPGFGFFRVPARNLLLVVVGLSGVTALLITELQTRSWEDRRNILEPALKLWLPGAITLAFGFAIFFVGWFASASHVEPMPHRAVQIANALTMAGVIGCGVWVVLWLWTHPDPRAAQWALRLAALLIVIDAWHIVIPLVTFDQVPEAPIWNGARTNIPTDSADRVLMIPLEAGPINTAMLTGHPHVHGYDPLPIDSFDKLASLSELLDPATRINALFGVNYVLSDEPYEDDQFELIGIAYDSYYYARTSTSPRVWFPAEIVTQPDDTAVRQELIRPRTNPLVTAFVDRDMDCSPGSGTATITEYGLNEVTIQADGDGGVLILTDQYYPGWSAAVDGDEVEIVRADTVFRAVCVPPGEHTVTFEYRPLSLIVGVIVSAAAWSLWAVLGMVAWIGSRHSVRPVEPPDE
jgi:hypothetical protein